MSAGAIVLAAGASTRMGRQKLLLPFAGTTVVAHIVLELHAGGVAAVYVVTGFEPEKVRGALAKERVTFAHNLDYTRGMLSSIRAGLASVPQDWSAVLIALGDQPLICAAHVTTLLQEHARTSEDILVPGHHGRRGHPLLLPRRFWQEAMMQHDDTGLRGLLHGHADRVRLIEVGTDDVLHDMDTPEEYDRTVMRASERDFEGR